MTVESIVQMRVHNNHSHTKSTPNRNSTAKQHAIVNIQLNIVTWPTYPDKFIRDNVFAPFVLLSIVIVTLPPNSQLAVYRFSDDNGGDTGGLFCNR